MDIARRNNLVVIHDAAQSCGTRIGGVPVGCAADITCFSFHATKNLVTGEGGAMVTNHDAWAERARVIRETGTDRGTPEDRRRYGYFGYYHHTALGNSYVQSDILGALALSQLKKLEQMNTRRKHIAARYVDELRGAPHLTLPIVAPNTEPNWHIFGVHLPADKLFAVRGALIAEGVMCETHYRPLHDHPYFHALTGGTDDQFSNATHFARTLLRLPIYPGLTETHIASIIEAVRKVCINMEAL
jgi:perosamine synthetase